jgi:hypothetical protein
MLVFPLNYFIAFHSPMLSRSSDCATLFLQDPARDAELRQRWMLVAADVRAQIKFGVCLSSLPAHR